MCVCTPLGAGRPCLFPRPHHQRARLRPAGRHAGRPDPVVARRSGRPRPSAGRGAADRTRARAHVSATCLHGFSTCATRTCASRACVPNGARVAFERRPGGAHKAPQRRPDHAGKVAERRASGSPAAHGRNDHEHGGTIKIHSCLGVCSGSFEVCPRSAPKSDTAQQAARSGRRAARGGRRVSRGGAAGGGEAVAAERPRERSRPPVARHCFCCDSHYGAARADWRAYHHTLVCASKMGLTTKASGSQRGSWISGRRTSLEINHGARSAGAAMCERGAEAQLDAHGVQGCVRALRCRKDTGWSA